MPRRTLRPPPTVGRLSLSGSLPPVIGRSAELSALTSALADHASQRGFTVAVGRAYPVETGVPYAVFSDALLPVLRTVEPSVLTLLTRGGTAELMQLFPALDGDQRSA